MLRKLENVQCPITKGGRVARAVKRIQHSASTNGRIRDGLRCGYTDDVQS